MLFARTPIILTKLFPELIWHFKRKFGENFLYLTFDDGPTPDITPWVLDRLREYQAKATFFCIGRNVERYPDIYDRIIEEGHAVGNHTYSHLKGWQTSNTEYFNDIQLAGNFISSDLFRPPYGRFKRSQINKLKQNFNIVMWNVLSYDFSRSITPEQCYLNVSNNIENGSIIVFHDSVKATGNLQYTLPRVLDKYAGSYEFRKIS